MWASGFEKRPVTVRFRPADPTWKVATQLFPGQTPFDFSAPNFQYLMDSPAELSNFELREWQVPGAARQPSDPPCRPPPGHQRPGRHAGRESQEGGRAADRPVRRVRRLTTRAPTPSSSTLCPTSTGTGWSIATRPSSPRSESLAATNYGRSSARSATNSSTRGTSSGCARASWSRSTSPAPTRRRLLWFAEGFTTYYGPLFIRRAGESTVDEFLARRFGDLERRAEQPRPRVRIAAGDEPARALPRRRGGDRPGDLQHRHQLLSLRRRDRPRARPDAAAARAVARRVHAPHVAAQRRSPSSPSRPPISKAGWPSSPAIRRSREAFFDRYIRGSALPDLAPLAAQAGLTLRQKNPKKAWAGRAELTVERQASDLVGRHAARIAFVPRRARARRRDSERPGRRHRQPRRLGQSARRRAGSGGRWKSASCSAGASAARP